MTVRPGITTFFLIAAIGANATALAAGPDRPADDATTLELGADPPVAGEPYVVVLGIAQDGGYPQAGCAKACCAPAWSDESRRRGVACIAVVDPASGQRWMVDATPDFREQLRILDQISPPRSVPDLSGILLTHAHIGHYTGLMHLGREAVGAKRIPVYAMPRLHEFLTRNGPWDQLVQLENIELRKPHADESVALGERVRITPFPVPHRDEYSETVGYRIDGPNHAVLYIPDIDKWERWDRAIEQLIADVDVAYLDGTFYADGEIPNRSMSEVPHPFIEESLRRFSTLPPAERAKIRFIHLNHTNPALQPQSQARSAIEAVGCRVAEVGERVGL